MHMARSLYHAEYSYGSTIHVALSCEWTKRGSNGGPNDGLTDGPNDGPNGGPVGLMVDVMHHQRLVSIGTILITSGACCGHCGGILLLRNLPKNRL